MIQFALDQARGLRHFARLSRHLGARVLPVFGTADRSLATANLASALARAGEQVLVIDASRAQIAPALGLTARYELKHVLEGEIALSEAVLTTHGGVQVLPAARGVTMLTGARVSGMDFLESLLHKTGPLDFVLVNADSAERAARLLPGHGETLLVLSRGPQAVSEGAVCLNGMSRHHVMGRVRVLMLRTPFAEARRTVTALAQFARARFGINVVFGGNAPPDRSLWEAARLRRSIFDIDAAGPAARAFHNAAVGVTDWELARVAVTPPSPGDPQQVSAAKQLH
jgi:flagellar biosynthesis protein FlhG